MPKLRLGVALVLPPPEAEAVDALRRALGDPALRRIPPHLTLVPPVNVREDRLDEALARLRAAAAATAPITLELGPPTTFLPVNPVLYLPVGGDLDELGRLRDRVFVEPLARPLTWPFVPHVTVADGTAPERIEAALAALADFRLTVGFERVHLLQEGEGRVWAPFADATLGGERVVGRGGLPLELSATEQPDPEARALLTERPLVVTARREGRVVGVARGRLGAQGAVLDELVVAPAVRGQGIGTHLLRTFLAEADTTVTVQADQAWVIWFRDRGWAPQHDGRLVLVSQR